MDFAFRRKLAVCRQRLQLRAHEFTKSTIDESFDPRAGSQMRQGEDAIARNYLSSVVARRETPWGSAS